jgi:hypothetical protein
VTRTNWLLSSCLVITMSSCRGSCSKASTSDGASPAAGASSAPLNAVEKAVARDICDDLMSSKDPAKQMEGIDCVKRRDGAK